VRPTLGGHGLVGKPLQTARQFWSRPVADASVGSAFTCANRT